ncbi:hypothetical protein HYU94_03810 [Candidatus Daviesbacteria bacterium]|nr:hypothetical protein [Candidatus Daviesbacteria bacterium]
MHITKASKMLLAGYLILAVWWSVLYFSGIKETFQNHLYQVGLGLIPLIGGIMGMLNSRKWGFLTSDVGKATFFISAGLTAWGIGQMFWSLYYNILLKIEIPYPSLADVGYVSALPLWTYGIIKLSKATGARASIKKLSGKLLLFVIPILAIISSYYLLIVIARQGVIDFNEGGLKLFFDLAYPLGDLIILTLALLIYGLSFNYLGGRFKLPIITVIGGFILMYFTDFTFSYVTTLETYFNGHWVDLMFPSALMLVAFGINNFSLGSD